MRVATKPGNRRRVTRNCQGQQAIPADLVTTDSRPSAEPIKKASASKAYRSQRADDWAHTIVGDRPSPCIHCGQPAMLRDPYTDRPCHMTCAQTHAKEGGEQW